MHHGFRSGLCAKESMNGNGCYQGKANPDALTKTAKMDSFLFRELRFREPACYSIHVPLTIACEISAFYFLLFPSLLNKVPLPWGGWSLAVSWSLSQPGSGKLLFPEGWWRPWESDQPCSQSMKRMSGEEVVPLSQHESSGSSDNEG